MSRVSESQLQIFFVDESFVLVKNKSKKNIKVKGKIELFISHKLEYV